MTATQADITVDGTWEDIAATDTDLASVDVLIQNKGNNPVLVFFGGGSAPTGNQGPYLLPGVATTGNAANIWVKAPSGSGLIAAEVR